MQVHANAKLVPSTRRLLVRRVLEEHWKVADVAAALGISERTVYRWLARWRGGDRRPGSADQGTDQGLPRARQAATKCDRRSPVIDTSPDSAEEGVMSQVTVGAETEPQSSSACTDRARSALQHRDEDR